MIADVPLNPLAIESQINGGIIQGISYALYEQRRLDRNTGLMVDPNLESYKIAGAFEVPEIETVILENYLALSSTDAGGIGEPATVPTAAAIANAFYNATGVRIPTIPMTPAVVSRRCVRRPGHEQLRARQSALGPRSDKSVGKGRDLQGRRDRPAGLHEGRAFVPRLLVNLQGIPGLDQINVDAKGNLLIGPTVTLSTVAENSTVLTRPGR